MTDESFGLQDLPIDTTEGELLITVAGFNAPGTKRDGETPAAPSLNLKFEIVKSLNDEEGARTPFIRKYMTTSEKGWPMIASLCKAWGLSEPNRTWAEKGYMDATGEADNWASALKGTTVYGKIKKVEEGEYPEKNELAGWGTWNGKHHTAFLKRYAKAKGSDSPSASF